jgi:hypothetical protein
VYAQLLPALTQHALLSRASLYYHSRNKTLHVTQSRSPLRAVNPTISAVTVERASASTSTVECFVQVQVQVQLKVSCKCKCKYLKKAVRYLRLASSAMGLFNRGNRVWCPQLLQLKSSVIPAQPLLFSVSFGDTPPSGVTAGESPAAPHTLQSGLLYVWCGVHVYMYVYYEVWASSLVCNCHGVAQARRKVTFIYERMHEHQCTVSIDKAFLWHISLQNRFELLIRGIAKVNCKMQGTKADTKRFCNNLVGSCIEKVSCAC